MTDLLRYMPKRLIVEQESSSDHVSHPYTLCFSHKQEGCVVIVDGQVRQGHQYIGTSQQTHALQWSEDMALLAQSSEAIEIILTTDLVLFEHYTQATVTTPLQLHITVPEGAQARLTHIVSAENTQAQAAVSTHVHVSQGACLSWWQYHGHGPRRMGYHHLSMESGAVVDVDTLFCATPCARNLMWVDLHGDNAYTHNSVQLCADKSYVESRVWMNHLGPLSQCAHQTLSVLAGSGQCIQQSRATIKPAAVGASVDQQLHARTLGMRAMAVCQPDIQVNTDQVQAAHGATVGRFDDVALWYLQSRGLSLQEAQVMQVKAFIMPLLERWQHSGVEQVIKPALTCLDEMLEDEYVA